MFLLNNTVLLIENTPDDIPEIAAIIDAAGYAATRIEATDVSDIVSGIQTYSPNVIVCHTSQSNRAMEAIVQSKQSISLILVGNPTDMPMVETHSSVKIGYITAPFTPTLLKAIINLLV